MQERSFRMRIDNDFEKKFSEVAGKNKSAFVRKTIEIMSSKDFQKSICLNNMEKMEELSSQCRKMLNESDGFLKVSTVSENFPAFISGKKDNNAYIFVKCPTYIVRILQQIDDQEIEKLNKLLDLNVSSQLVASERLLLSDKEQKKVFLYETTCLGENLEKNKEIKKSVEQKFKDAGYETEINVSYYIISTPIKLVKIDGEDYFALKKKFDS